MTPDDDASRPLDDRLAATRDAVLSKEERVVAQEEGDPGQAIVLTESRILIIKVGITATGAADGSIVGEFPLNGIESVTLRKGLVGAVIHVATAEKHSPTPGSPPDNVIVFTGPVRVEKCQAMAARIESVLGKPVGLVEPELPRSDQAAAQPAQPVVEHAEAQPSMSSEAAPQQPETEAFIPNPNLPKPARRGSGPVKKALVLFALLMAAVIVCVGTTTPLRNPGKTPTVEIDVGDVTNGSSALTKRRAALASYRAEVGRLLKPCTKAVSALAVAVRSGDRAAIRAALCEDTADQCWRKISHIEPPPGLSAAKGHIVSGCFTLKIAAASIAAAARSSQPVVPSRLVGRLVQGQKRIDSGLGLIDKIRARLDRQIRGS